MIILRVLTHIFIKLIFYNIVFLFCTRQHTKNYAKKDYYFFTHCLSGLLYAIVHRLKINIIYYLLREFTHLQRKGAGLALHLGGSPQTCTRYGKPAPCSDRLIRVLCSLFGVVISKVWAICLHLRCDCKDTKYICFYLAYSMIFHFTMSFLTIHAAFLLFSILINW